MRRYPDVLSLYASDRTTGSAMDSGVGQREGQVTDTTCTHLCESDYEDNNAGSGQVYTCEAGSLSGSLLECTVSSPHSLSFDLLVNQDLRHFVTPVYLTHQTSEWSTTPGFRVSQPVLQMVHTHSYSLDVWTLSDVLSVGFH